MVTIGQIMRTFAKRLKAARIVAGYESAAKFANALGLEPHTYRKYERGDAAPNIHTLTRMCCLLKITPNYLLPIAAGERKGHAPATDGNATAA